MSSPQTSTLTRDLRRLALLQDGAGLSDQQLLECVLTRQEEAAFQALVQRHGPLVFGVCRRILGNHHDAEDAFQAVFLVFIRKARSIAKRDRIGHWLYRVAYRTASKMKAMTARRRVKEAEAGTSRLEAASDPWPELERVLDEELDRLPEKYQIPIVLCDLQGKLQREAARQMGCPEKTLSSRLIRGRQMLAKRLARRGITVTAVSLMTLLPQHALAAMPAPLVISTAKAAMIFALGKVVTTAISAKAAALADGVLKMMLMSKLKVAGALVLAVSIVGTGVGMSLMGQQPAQQQKVAGSKPKEEKAAREEKKQASVDRYGDPLPEGAVARLGTVRFRHEWTIYAVAVSPDGKLVAAGGNNVVCLFDAATGRELRRMMGQPFQGIQALAFSRDGKVLASAHWDDHIFLWDVASGKEMRRLKGFQTSVNEYYPSCAHLAFTPDDKALVSLGRDRTIRLWDLGTGQQTRQFTQYADNQIACALSPDGKIIASGGLDKIVHLWEANTGKEIFQMKGHKENILGLAFSPDGSIVASGGDTDNVFLWDVSSGKELRQLKPKRPPGQGGVYTRTNHVTFSPDGKTLVAGGGAWYYSLFDVASGKELGLPGVPWNSSPISFMPDGQTLLFLLDTEEDTVRFVEAKTGKPLREFEGHTGRLESTTFSPDGKLIATSTVRENGIRLWDTATRKEIRKFREYPIAAGRVAFSADGRALVSSGFDTTLWDVGTGKVQKRLGQNRHVCYALGFSGNGTTFHIADHAGSIRTLDVDTGRVTRTTNMGHQIWAAAFSSDGSWATTADQQDKQIHIWEMATGKKLRTVERRRSGSVALAISRDGRTIAADTGEAWETATGGRRKPEPAPVGVQLTAIAFAPNGRMLAGAQHVEFHSKDALCAIVVWELPSGKKLREFKGHRGWVSDLCFSPDSKLLLSGGHDTTALLWGVADLVPTMSKNLAHSDIKRLWASLDNPNAMEACRTIWELISAPEPTIAFLRQQMQPAAEASPEMKKEMGEYLAKLDNDDFKVRQTVKEKLAQLSDVAAPQLRAVLAKNPSPHVRREVEHLLGIIHTHQVRLIRTAEVLEHIATPEARELLRKLAGGAPEARLTQEAKASLARLDQRAASKP